MLPEFTPEMADEIARKADILRANLEIQIAQAIEPDASALERMSARLDRVAGLALSTIAYLDILQEIGDRERAKARVGDGPA